jgi:hypothetical protein
MKKTMLTLTALLLTGCNDKWAGFVYPTASLVTHVNSGSYDSFEDCQTASISMLRTMDAQAAGSYECGKNCKFQEEYGMQVCEETRN